MTIADLVVNSVKALVEGKVYSEEFDLMAQLLDFCRIWGIEIPIDEQIERTFRNIIKKMQVMPTSPE